MDASEIRSNETAARDARPGRWAVLLFVAGNGLLVLTFMVGGFGVASSPDFGWKQRTTVVVGVGVALVGLVWLCAKRARSAEAAPERQLLVAAAQLLGLSALAIAQPLFDLLADNAEFFTARGSDGLDVAVFTGVLVLVPPLVLLGTEVLVGLVSEPARRVVHLVFVAGLAGLLVLNAISDNDRVPGGLLLLLAAYAGIVVAAAVWATRGAAMLATALAPAALLFALLFLTSQDISAVFARDTVGRGAANSEKVPVVLVVFDEFPTNLLLGRDGRIDARRFPNFARLAGTSTWYPNATAVSDETTAAVPAILTGQAPNSFALPISSQHPDNLFSLLSRTHRMNVHEEITRMCAEKICGVNREAFGSRMRSVLSDSWVVYRRMELPASLRRGLPDISQGWEDFGAAAQVEQAPGADALQHAVSSDRVARFHAFLRSLRSGGDKPGLNFAHVLLPHVPWTYLPSGRAYDNSSYFPGYRQDGRMVGSDATRFSAFQRMLLQTRLVDRLLGELLQRLQTTGLLDKAVVVIVADHGASVLPNDFRRRITQGNSGEMAPVPLFVKAPGQRKAATVKSHVRTFDVLPTIADLLGLRVPWRIDGRSLRTKPYPEPSRLTLFRVAGGKQVTVPVSSFERTRATALARQWRDFGVGDPFPGRAGPGHHDALLGKPVARVSRPEPGPPLVLDKPQRFEQVDLEGGPVPAFVTGRATGLGPGDTHDVAIAVNGTVAAVGRTFDAHGGQAFAIFVPDDVLRQGRNDVRAYQVAGTGKAARLLAGG